MILPPIVIFGFCVNCNVKLCTVVAIPLPPLFQMLLYSKLIGTLQDCGRNFFVTLRLMHPQFVVQSCQKPLLTKRYCQRDVEFMVMGVIFSRIFFCLTLFYFLGRLVFPSMDIVLYITLSCRKNSIKPWLHLWSPFWRLVGKIPGRL